MPAAARIDVQRLSTLIPPFLVVCIAIAYNWWALSPERFFSADDWDWLSRAAFWPWSKYAAIFPTAIYNDRPAGAAFIKLQYELFGLHFHAYAISSLALHIANCLLLFAFVRRYLSATAAFVASALAATWMSADGAVTWLAAIFDLLGATLIMLMLVAKQHANRVNRVWPTVVAVIAYVLAIRTKEFALSGAVLIFLMEYLCERKSLRRSFVEAAPFFVVLVIYGSLYAYHAFESRIAVTGLAESAHLYNLHINLFALLDNLRFYLGALFYVEILGVWGLIGLMAAFAVGFWLSSAISRRVIVFAALGFLLMMGPTLALSLQRYPLYLYTAHFFAAMSIGALCDQWRQTWGIGIAIATLVFAAPLVTPYRSSRVAFSLNSNAQVRQQFTQAVDLLGPTLPRNALVVISGVTPYFNPFSFGPGDSLRIVYGDQTLDALIEKPDEVLAKAFCGSNRPRRFISFRGPNAKDITSEIEKSCPITDQPKQDAR